MHPWHIILLVLYALLEFYCIRNEKKFVLALVIMVVAWIVLKTRRK